MRSLPLWKRCLLVWSLLGSLWSGVLGWCLGLLALVEQKSPSEVTGYRMPVEKTESWLSGGSGGRTPGWESLAVWTHFSCWIAMDRSPWSGSGTWLPGNVVEGGRIVLADGSTKRLGEEEACIVCGAGPRGLVMILDKQK